ncbi:hypothetical protein ACOME3_001444 [Neoechinorhynchus agilis]
MAYAYCSTSESLNKGLNHLGMMYKTRGNPANMITRYIMWIRSKTKGITDKSGIQISVPYVNEATHGDLKRIIKMKTPKDITFYTKITLGSWDGYKRICQDETKGVVSAVIVITLNRRTI